VIVVSHDRHFLNTVCTHMADIDFNKLTIYTGNYEFWRQSTELNQRLRADQNKKSAEKAEELKSFIARFSANASKSRQASSRQKQLEKLDLSEIPVSSRRSPFVGFNPDRNLGKDLLTVENLSKTVNGEKVLDKVSFTLHQYDKVAFLAKNDVAITTLFEILNGRVEPDSGTYTWGITTSLSYFPKDNTHYFKDSQAETLVDWLRDFSKEKDESFIRGFLGKMLFSGDEAMKKPTVLSGGEKVRCLFSKMMLSGANVLILDGPTAHLDLESISAVNEGVRRFSGSVLFTSQDYEFIQTVANRIIEIDVTVMDDQTLTYEEYLAR